MDSRKAVLHQTLTVAAGVLICTAAMVGVFVALNKFEWNVLWGAVTGWLVISLNHLFLGITVSNAADRAEKGEVKAARNMLALSSTVRLVCMGGAVVLAIFLGANAVAAALPLLFARPVLSVTEFFGKKGDQWTDSK